MATLVLMLGANAIIAGSAATATAAAGTFAAGTGAAFLLSGSAAALGAYIDSRIFAPSPPPTGPNRDANFQTADEGSPVPLAYGEVRVPCTPIWVSKTRKRKHTTSGGKGGSGGNHVVNQYSVDIAYVCCANAATIVQVIANGKKIYAVEPDVDFIDFDPSATASTRHVDNQSIDPNTGELVWQVTDLFEIESDILAVDLSDLISGNDVTISNWSGIYGSNNDTFEVWSVRYDDDTDKSYLTIRYVHPLLYEPAFFPPPRFQDYPGALGQLITIHQTNLPFSQKLIDDIETYNASETQNASPTIESREPLGAPAFRDYTYFVLKNLQLIDFGNSPPIKMEAIVRTHAFGELSVGEVIKDLCLRSGLEASSTSADACTMPIRGYYAMGAQAATNALDPILIAYDIIKQENAGVISFFPRADAVEIDIDEDDLAAHSLGANTERDIHYIDGGAFDLPRSCTVSYKDIDRKYQSGAQRVRRARSTNKKQLNFDLPIALEAGEAHAIAARSLWLAHVNARKIQVSLPPKYLETVRESQRLNLTSGAHSLQVLLTQVDIGDNYVLSCEGLFEDPRILAQPSISETQASGDSSFGGQDGTGSQNSQSEPPFLSWGTIDVCCLDDAHVDQVGFYAYASVPDENIEFSGAQVLESLDDGTSWNEVAILQNSAVNGHARTVASLTALPGFWDDVSTIDVYINEGDLESVTDLQCQNGMNRFMYGAELIGAVNAVLIARNTYRLSRLLRGFQGTEAAIGQHYVGDRVVCVTQPGVEFVSLNLAAVGQTRRYRCVPFGGRLEDYDADELVIAPVGATVRPLSPVHISATRDSSNNVTVSYTRRSRGITRLLAEQPIPIHEARSTWYVEVLDKPTGLDVVRTTALSSTAETVDLAYSAANQTTDGYTPGDPINFRITSSSDWLGRGTPAEATV